MQTMDFLTEIEINTMQLKGPCFKPINELIKTCLEASIEPIKTGLMSHY